MHLADFCTWNTKKSCIWRQKYWFNATTHQVRSQPGLVNELGRKVFQNGKVPPAIRHSIRFLLELVVNDIPNEISVGVSLSTKLDWTIQRKKLLEEWRAGEPHPGSSVHRPIGVEQEFVKDLWQETQSMAYLSRDVTNLNVLSSLLPTISKGHHGSKNKLRNAELGGGSNLLLWVEPWWHQSRGILSFHWPILPMLLHFCPKVSVCNNQERVRFKSTINTCPYVPEHKLGFRTSGQSLDFWSLLWRKILARGVGQRVIREDLPSWSKNDTLYKATAAGSDPPFGTDHSGSGKRAWMTDIRTLGTDSGQSDLQGGTGVSFWVCQTRLPMPFSPDASPNDIKLRFHLLSTQEEACFEYQILKKALVNTFRGPVGDTQRLFEWA